MIAVTLVDGVELHQYPHWPILLNEKLPSRDLLPPGRAVKPLLLVAPVLGLAHLRVPACLSFPPARSAPSRHCARRVHSASVGICHPAGASSLSLIPSPLLSPFTANQLYSFP